METILHIKSLLLSLIFFLNISYSDTTINNDKCGYGYNTYEGIIKESPFSKPKCITLAQNSNRKIKLIQITNLKHLFKHLSIPQNKQFFNNYFVKKIFDNPHINSYTLTYMIYQDITVFKTVIQNDKIDLNYEDQDFIKKFGDSYIKEVKSGGEHIVFFHILTDSLLEYKKSKKTLKRSLGSLKKFQKAIENISKKHHIVVKEFFTKPLEFIPANELSQTFISFDNFTKFIKKNNIPYKFTIAKYQDLNTTSIEENKKILQTIINNLLSIKYRLNNYNYYRHNLDLFLPLDENRSRKIRTTYTKYKNLLKDIQQNPTNFTELNTTIPKEELPKRYKASTLQQTITIKPQSLTLSTEELIPKVQPQKNIKIYLQSKLDIQNHGQLLRIINTLSYKIEDKKYTKTDTRLLFDTYVNFSGLRFESILNDYGTATLSVAFNKYEQYINIEGAGIIDKADCGYEVTTNNKLKISCKNIKYKPIKIKFIHEEDL